MDTVIKGRVLYRHLSDHKILVNIETDNHKKIGLTITCTETFVNAYPKLWGALISCQKISLHQRDGQIVGLSTEKLDFLQNEPNLGFQLRDKPECKIYARYMGCGQIGNMVKLHLVNRPAYLFKCQDEKAAAHLTLALRKSRCNDVLVLQQEADGRISSVVNTTQAFEVNCR